MLFRERASVAEGSGERDSYCFQGDERAGPEPWPEGLHFFKSTNKGARAVTGSGRQSKSKNPTKNAKNNGQSTLNSAAKAGYKYASTARTIARGSRGTTRKFC